MMIFFLTLPNTFEIIFLILLFILYIKELYLYLKKKKKIREKYLQQTALRLKMSSLFKQQIASANIHTHFYLKFSKYKNLNASVATRATPF